jgi:hypothetical protein
MDVCDKVTTEDSGAKDAVASMIKRLAHRNANVQLYTLEVRGFWISQTFRTGELLGGFYY